MKKFFLFSLVFAVFAALMMTSCKKSDENPESVVVPNEVQELLSSSQNSKVDTTSTLMTLALGAAAPSISSLGGATASGFYSNGQWSGNVSACGSKSLFNGYYIINTDYSPDVSNYWLINGSNFGTTTGSVLTNNSAITMQVLSWSNTQIKVRPVAPINLDYKNGFAITVRTSAGATASRTNINILGMLAAGRGFGQCTWEAAFQRKLVNRSIPSPSAYSTTGSVNASYTPQQYDVINWGAKHTGIIMTAPQVSTASGITTYTFQIRERNQNCDEANATTSVQTFKRSSTTVTQGIYSNNRNLGTVTSYWR